MTPASAKKTFTFLLTILTSYFHGDFFLFFSLFAETKQVFIQSCLVKSSRSFFTYLNRLFTRIKHSQNISKYLYSWWEKKQAGGAWGFKIILMMKWWKRPFHEVYCVWGNLCVCVCVESCTKPFSLFMEPQFSGFIILYVSRRHAVLAISLTLRLQGRWWYSGKHADKYYIEWSVGKC